jgi:hypothetical protein
MLSNASMEQLGVASVAVIMALAWVRSSLNEKAQLHIRIKDLEAKAQEDREYERERSLAQHETLLKVNGTMQGIETSFVALTEVLK